jgi:hypothetical protein
VLQGGSLVSSQKWREIAAKPGESFRGARARMLGFHTATSNLPEGGRALLDSYGRRLEAAAGQLGMQHSMFPAPVVAAAASLEELALSLAHGSGVPVTLQGMQHTLETALALACSPYNLVGAAPARPAWPGSQPASQPACRRAPPGWPACLPTCTGPLPPSLLPLPPADGGCPWHPCRGVYAAGYGGQGGARSGGNLRGQLQPVGIKLHWR